MAEIGRVGPSRREVSGVTPSINPQAFGAGVAQALGSLGGELAGLAQTQVQREVADTSLSQAYLARQDKLESARLRADLIRLDNEMSRQLSERYDAAPLGAPNFTNESQAWVQSQLENFKRRIPERLQPDFEAELASISEGKINAAFRLQTSAENAEFTRIIGDLQRQATEEMLTAVILDPSELDDLEAGWVEDLTKLMADSPMAAEETRALAEGISVAISSAKMSRLVTEEAINNVSSGGALPGQIKQEGRRVYSDRPVAAGLSRSAVGFLQATSGVESGGDYNVMYSPDGRRYFDDFSWHPNQSAIIASGPNAGKRSTAAGRYMFTYATWVEVAAELGLTDFSPASQDAAAWHLAQKRFTALTGRDLTAVLESGNQAAIIAAKRVLEPTWEGFKNLSDQAFVDAIASATGNPSSILFDEEFSHIPLNQRFAILEDGLAQASQIRNIMQAEAQAQRAAMIADVEQMLFDGSGGMREFEILKSQIRLTVDEQESLLKVYRDNQTQRAQSEQMLASVDDPLFTFDPGNSDHKNMAGSFFAQTQVGQRLAEGDEEYVNTLMLPMVKASNGFVPSNVVGVLSQQMSSQNPQQAAFAFSTMAKLAAESPEGFNRAFGNDIAQQVVAYNFAQSSLPRDELLSYIRGAASPEGKARREFANEVYREARRDRPDDFFPQQLARDLGARGGIAAGAGDALFSEFYGAYQYQLGVLGDHKKARDAALQVLGQTWGTTNVGGTARLIKHPPEKIFPPFDGGYSWIDEQLLQEFPGLVGQRYELISDHITDAQRAEGRTPTYMIVQYDEWGMPRPMLATNHIHGQGTDPNTIARWNPEITQQMTLDLYERRAQESLRGNRRQDEAPTPRELPEFQIDGLFDELFQPQEGPPAPPVRDQRRSPPPVANMWNTPGPEGRPRTYNQWRALSTEERRKFGLDFTRLDAIRHFGLAPFSNLPPEER